MEIDKATYDRQNGILRTVATHLKSQGLGARSPAGECVYLNDKGHKCAVGALIPAEHYNPAFEGATLQRWAYGTPSYVYGSADESIRKKEALLLEALDKSGISRDDYMLLAAVQDVHDSSFCSVGELEDFWWYVRSGLLKVAESFHLDPRVIPE